MEPQRFETTAVAIARGRVLIRVPFDPDAVWGVKTHHHVGGELNGRRVRGVVEIVGDGYGFILGPTWLRDCGVAAGDVVQVVIEPEGPQRGDLPADLVAALAENPAAGEFFDSLAQFYRKGYLQWIEATKRNPGRRAERITETVRLLAAQVKSRPKGDRPPS